MQFFHPTFALLRLPRFGCYTIDKHSSNIMKTYQRLLIFGLVVLALAALISPWAAAAWWYFTDAHPGWERYSFSKIFDRTFMVMGIVTFFTGRRFLRLGSLKELGLSPQTRAVRDVVSGPG